MSAITNQKTPPSSYTGHAQPYLGQGWINAPSFLNFYYLPIDFIKSVKDQIIANKLGDQEGSLENYLRIVEAPFNISSSTLTTISSVCKILSFAHLEKVSWVIKIFKVTPIIGAFVSGIEALIELIGIRAARGMLKTLDMSILQRLYELKNPSTEALKALLEKIKKNTPFLKAHLHPEEIREFALALHRGNHQTLLLWKEKITKRCIASTLKRLNQEYCKKDPDKIRMIEKYVSKQFPTLSQEEQQEKCRHYEELCHELNNRRLTRRIFPRAAKEFYETMPALYAASKGPNLNQEKAFALLTDLKTQAQKKIFMQSIGVVSALLTLAAMVLIIHLGGNGLTYSLLITGGTLSCGRFAVNVGMMHTKGWVMDRSSLIPDCFKRASPQPA